MDYRPRQQRRSWFTFLGGSLEQTDIGEADDQTLSHTEATTSFLLSQANVGDLVWIVGFAAGPEGRQRLISMGLNRGTELEVVNRTAGGSIMVAVANTRLGLGLDIADKIYVRQSVIQARSDPSHTQTDLKIASSPSLTQEKPMQTRLRDLAVGSQGRIVGYDQGSGSYRQKLLAMGLTPNAEFKITRQAPLGDPVELEVRGFNLSLRKIEADALIVEPVDHA
ncbi:MAG: FeoA family protein [Cyanobacteria bacterium P01_H01_bin.21]